MDIVARSLASDSSSKLHNLSSIINAVCYLLQKNISYALLFALHNTQCALLILIEANEGQTIIQLANIGVFV